MAQEALDDTAEQSTEAADLYTLRLPEEGVRQIIGGLGIMSGMSMKEKYEDTMHAVQYQYEE